MKALMKKVWVVTVAVAMVLLFALPCLFGGLSAKGKVPSPRDDDSTQVFSGAKKVSGISVCQVEINKWVIAFVFTAPYLLEADSVSIHHFSGEPYPLEWIPSTTRSSRLEGDRTFVVFERDWDHDITRMLWYAGYELGFSVGLFKNGKVVAGQEILVVADIEGVKIPEPHSQPTVATQSDIDAVATPKKFELAQNYPNPFNPTTTIFYSLDKSSQVSLKIFDALGREIAVLVDDEYKSAGVYLVRWNASNFSSGTYFYKLENGGKVLLKQMTLLK